MEPAAYEIKTLFPREVSPGRYQHVDPQEIVRAAAEGWELTSASTFVLLNEERGNDVRKPVVTQAYLAYFFKRIKSQPDR